MDINTLKFNTDIYVIPESKLNVPLLDTDTEVWFDTERRAQERPTPKQWKTFLAFLNIDEEEVTQLDLYLNYYRSELADDGRIKRTDVKFDSLRDLNITSIVLPRQDRTPHEYLIVLAETSWIIRGSRYSIELEMIFRDNRFLFLQEMTGLWCRLEWDYVYNVHSRV